MLFDKDLLRQLTGVEADIDAKRLLLDLEAYDYEDSLYEFMKAGWRYIDPNPFADNWHLGAIAEHLQAVCDGEITRLIINQPPRTTKSSMLVAFDPWVWAQREHTDTSGPGVQFLHASYAQTLSIRDSVKTRRLLESPWYQTYWGNRVQITSDQNTKIRFDNAQGGYRLATSVDGALTGEGGSIIIIDDPHNATEAESEAVRTSTIEWFDTSLSTRLNNPQTGAVILVMQRLHEEDLTGHILSSDAGSDWVHLMLPMRYEQERARIIYPNAIGWSDPRTEEGELLTPQRYDEKSVRKLERQLGPYGTAGQLQQRPEPKGGGILKRDFWMNWDRPTYPPVSYVLASIDTAYTEKQENDFSAMTVWGIFENDNEVPCAILMNAWAERLELHDLVLKIGATAKKFNVDHMLVENKATGISVEQELRRIFSYENFSVQMIDPKNQDKIARAYSVQPIMSEGCVMKEGVIQRVGPGIVYAPLDFSWADLVITQCAAFPKGKHDDIVDTVTQALRFLRQTGMISRGEERTAQTAEDAMFKGNTDQSPLYPGS
jgi:predicted phage terminase large subunit-like protein